MRFHAEGETSMDSGGAGRVARAYPVGRLEARRTAGARRRHPAADARPARDRAPARVRGTDVPGDSRSLEHFARYRGWAISVRAGKAANGARRWENGRWPTDQTLR